MGYTTLKRSGGNRKYSPTGLKTSALAFIRNCCEGLRFDEQKAEEETREGKFLGTSIAPGDIPYNMQMDIERLCLENAVERFLRSGKKEDAFDVYFCYLEMFVGDYEKTRRMIELLSEYEANGSALLMKHRDHYSHSVYVFTLGLAFYQANPAYRKKYQQFYHLTEEKQAACHYLQYWGFASLFHDIGYPFELPFEQVASYFEVDGDKRTERPFVSYQALDQFIKVDENLQAALRDALQEAAGRGLLAFDGEETFETTNDVFAYLLWKRLGATGYQLNEEEIKDYLKKKPEHPEIFGHFMDHAYFSATVLLKKLFGRQEGGPGNASEGKRGSVSEAKSGNAPECKLENAPESKSGNKPGSGSEARTQEEMRCRLQCEHLDAMTAILIHNSLYKFCIANPEKDPNHPEMHLSYKDAGNIPFKAEYHPLAFMLMLCDELQCWDRTAYGRNSRRELHPMRCSFRLSEDAIVARYVYDQEEKEKTDGFENAYHEWQKDRTLADGQGAAGAVSPGSGTNGEKKKCPKLKAYSEMYIKNGKGISGFQEDIERIVDLTDMKLSVEIQFGERRTETNQRYLSDSNFINLYHFAVILNGRWGSIKKWKAAKEAGKENEFLSDEGQKKEFEKSFKNLSLEYKLSNINQAKAFARYMNEIGGFYTDKDVDFEILKQFEPEELGKIGILEHKRWLQEHLDMGWEYGTPEKKDRDYLRQHKDMIPGFDLEQADVSDEQAKKNYDRLEKSEQDKDTEPMECMLAMLKLYDGLRMYRLK